MVRILQEVKAKVYQSTAAAAAMENAVEQTSKFVFYNLVRSNLLTDGIKRLLCRTLGRSCCVLCMEILFLKPRFWSCFYTASSCTLLPFDCSGADVASISHLPFHVIRFFRSALLRCTLCLSVPRQPMASL